ncbi:uncharacterized protein J4E79_004294 [Alternaria viburni]|uniref:uncharacterized protein n=1 Tax=Alternaria viburni TaxID=566460 RepID=UPI0020C21DF8|nr:uncharacterized protein J4E79_004294 [Alternaria viburni]KAI4662982.1 hypothetical protein J4E79_004294 [Alternaria viburni]
MARPPYMVESYETVKWWETLCRLLRLERKKDTLDDYQQLVGRHDGLQDLMHVIAEADGSPAPTMDLIKSNLGLARDFVEELGKATELYNIAVCRVIGPAMYTTLPREIRDMVYEYLTPHQLDITLRPCYPCAESDLLHVVDHVNPKYFDYDLYFAPQPRSQDDWLCPEHYWRDNIISPGVAQELMEAWYRNSTFNMWADWICEGWPAEWLNTLLNNDRFGAGLRPREMITKFAFEVQISYWRGEIDSHWQKSLMEALDSLFSLKEATQIDLSVRCGFGEDPMAALRAFLVLIRPAFLRLQKLGYRCTIRTVRRKPNPFSKVIGEWVQELETEVKGNDNAGLIGV